MTGAAGFIASRVCRMLLDSGHEVLGVDDLNESSDVRLKERRLSELSRPRFSLAFSYHHQYGLDVSVLRYFTVSGPAGRPGMSPFRFVKRVFEGLPVQLFGDGTHRLRQALRPLHPPRAHRARGGTESGRREAPRPSGRNSGDLGPGDPDGGGAAAARAFAHPVPAGGHMISTTTPRRRR